MRIRADRLDPGGEVPGQIGDPGCGFRIFPRTVGRTAVFVHKRLLFQCSSTFQHHEPLLERLTALKNKGLGYAVPVFQQLTGVLV